MEEQYPIRSGVPIPPRRLRGNAMKYPLRDLNIGDSFEFPLDEIVAVRNSVKHVRETDGRHKTFSVRIKNNTAGAVWRLT